MDYVELPEHLNFSHNGVNSAVSVRLEGGNSQGGFCLEEFTSTVPFTKLYGHLPEVRRMMTSAIKCLPAFINMAIEGEIDEQIRSSNQGWFLFEYRSPNYRIAIYCGPQGVSVTRNGVHPTHRLSAVSKTDLRAALRSAHARMEAIYRRFYNI